MQNNASATGQPGHRFRGQHGRGESQQHRCLWGRFPTDSDGTVDLGATENADSTSPQLLTPAVRRRNQRCRRQQPDNYSNESAQADTANITLYEFVDGTITGDTLVEAFNPAAITAGLGTTTNTNDTITLNPTANLDEETNYYVIIDAAARHRRCRQPETACGDC